MSETAQEQPAAEEAPLLVNAETGEVIEPDDADEQNEGLEDEEDPDEIEAEAAANFEREQELAAERQEEAASIEAQQREQEAKNKKLVQLAGHVAKRYNEILGSDLDGFVPCPLCLPWFPGIRLPVMPDYEVVAAVKVAIGEDPDPPLTNDHYSKVCDDCAGLGKVLTGSKVSGETTARCLPCKGRGWVAIGPEREKLGITGEQHTPAEYVAAIQPANGDEPPEAAALKALGYIVVPPVNTPESIAAQGG